MKEAKTEPIEMNLEELFQFALTIEEASINPGKDADGNLGIARERKWKLPYLANKGVKVK
jgi:hypothetical protein